RSGMPPRCSALPCSQAPLPPREKSRLPPREESRLQPQEESRLPGGQAPLGVVVTPAMAVLPAPPVVAVARQRFQARAAPEISIPPPHYGSTGPVQLETPVLGSSAQPAPRRRTSRVRRRCS